MKVQNVLADSTDESCGTVFRVRVRPAALTSASQCMGRVGLATHSSGLCRRLGFPLLPSLALD